MIKIGSGPLQSLMRQSLLQSTTSLRGGHGWDRPDVPLMVEYQHKRQMSIFDTNMWFYCAVQPEYFINQNESYLENYVKGAKHMLINGRYVLYLFLACFVSQSLLFNSWNTSRYPEVVETFPGYVYPVKARQERLPYKKHFLDLTITPDNSHVRPHLNYISYMERKGNYMKERLQSNQLQMEEASAYLQRVEKEAREQVSKSKE